MLDLRDNETEGHSQRVTLLAVAFSRMMGIEIPVYARMFALIDSWDALTPNRSLSVYYGANPAGRSCFTDRTF